MDNNSFGWQCVNAGAQHPAMIVVSNDINDLIVFNHCFSNYNRGFISHNTIGAWRHKKVVVRDPSLEVEFLTAKHPLPNVIVL